MILDLGAEGEGEGLLDVFGVLGATQPAECNILLVVVTAVLEGVVDDVPLCTIVSMNVPSLRKGGNSPPSRPGSRRTGGQFHRRFHEG